MSGVKLAYRCTSLASKTFALLWVVFLLIGCGIKVFDFFLSKIYSVATDMDTAIKLASVPNFL